jgi:hypothetical protein
MSPLKNTPPMILVLALAALMDGCGSNSTGPQKIVCNQPLKVEFLSNTIKNTFYPSSTWEQAKDMLNPTANYHKYGMNYNASVRLRNLNNGTFVVKRSVGQLIIKRDEMDQKSYESVLSQFKLRAKRDTVINFTFKVDIKSLSLDYFKLIASGDKVGYFFSSGYKYSYDSAAICLDDSLPRQTVAASDSTVKDYVSIPEIADATYTGTVATAEATATAARWSVDNWSTIRCALLVLVVIIGITLGGHAGGISC